MLGYVLAGLVAFIVLRALGEMAVHEPVAGSFAHYAGKYIGPLAGYLVGWGYWTYWIVVGLAEVTAVGIYMMMWFPDVPQWVWALSSLLAMGGINFVAVKVFGEFEFWFSLIKVVAIVTMITMGCGMIFFGLGVGGEPIGIANLWQHGGFFPNGVSGFLLSLQMVLFAYVGIEMIGLSAGEAENPTKTIPMAIDSLAWRILIFYVGALFVILAIFPWHQVGQQGSPFVAMFESIGLRQAAGIINFVVITAALSSCNAGIFSGGRLLLGLSKIGNAPQALGDVSKSGVPMKAILMTILLPTLGVALNYFVPEKAFQWITAAVTLIGLLVWIAILYTQIQFRKSLTQTQRDALPYRAILWPYGSWFAIFFVMFVIGLMAYSESTRMAFYVGPPILIGLTLLYFIFGLHKKERSAS
jgi:AAT family amino acid transporter